MKILSGIIMLIGVIIGAITYGLAESAPQQAIALVHIAGGYVTARMMENFIGEDANEVLKLLKANLKKEESKAKTTPSPKS